MVKIYADADAADDGLVAQWSILFSEKDRFVGLGSCIGYGLSKDTVSRCFVTLRYVTGTPRPRFSTSNAIVSPRRGRWTNKINQTHKK